MNRKNLFNVPIFVGSYKEFINLSISEKGYNCFLNSHMLYENSKNPAFKGVLKNATNILPDGMPIVYSLRFFGRKKQDRIAGNDVIFTLLEAAKDQKLKVFFVGSTEELLGRISKILMKKGIKHKTYSPPFKPIEEYDFDKQAQIIQEFNPNIILVGLGCPKQEQWMYKMKDRVNASMYGLGGAFLLYAGVDSRAPKWMRNLAMEWLYRLGLEPSRLFKRYFITNTYFCYLFIKELVINRLRIE